MDRSFVAKAGARTQSSSRRALNNALAASSVLFVAVASCSGGTKPPPPSALTNALDAGGESTDATMPSGVGDASTTSPPADAGQVDQSTGASVDAAPEASLVTPTGCVATDPDAANVKPMMCLKQCVDINSDPKNCGACSVPCNLTGEVCIIGMCQCPGTQTPCGNQCVDLNSDSSNCGSCGHNCENNPCNMGVCQASVIGQWTVTNVVIAGFAVDSSSVYWTQEQGSAAGVFYKPIAGNPAPNSLGGTIDPRGLVVDLTYAYWVDYTEGSVNRSVLVGGPSSQVALVPPVDDGGVTPGPLALAIDGQNVYWVESVSGNVNMTPKNPYPDVDGVKTLAMSQDNPRAIAVDGTSVYWINHGSLANSGSVNKTAIEAFDAASQPVMQLATGENQPWDIAVDKTSVYWTDAANPSGTIKSVPIGGGTVRTLAQNQAAPHGIAVDSQYVYWTTYDGNTISKVALAGGPVFTIASGQSTPEAIAVDDSSVYWVNQASGEILKVAK